MDENIGVSSQRSVTIILRLLVGKDGEIVQGQIVSVRGESAGWFRTWPEAERAIRASARRERRGA